LRSGAWTSARGGWALA